MFVPALNSPPALAEFPSDIDEVVSGARRVRLNSLFSLVRGCEIELTQQKRMRCGRLRTSRCVDRIWFLSQSPESPDVSVAEVHHYLAHNLAAVVGRPQHARPRLNIERIDIRRFCLCHILMRGPNLGSFRLTSLPISSFAIPKRSHGVDAPETFGKV